ncbi:MAG: immunity 17 family protein [Deltaproteobacteria bacterium]|nr:immunity 17 family protein [Deltaproteobacteria bacterium]
MQGELLGLLFVAIGLFSILGAWKNWDFFMNARKARTFVRLIGRTGTRWFYGILGAGLVAFGFVVTLGLWSPAGY